MSEEVKGIDRVARNTMGFMERFRQMDLKTVQGYRYLFTFLLVVDLFGLFWFLSLKKVGIILFIVCVIFIGFFSILERTLMSEMPIEQYRKMKKLQRKVKENKERYTPLDLGIGQIDDFTKEIRDMKLT